MSQPFIGEIRLFGGNFAPRGFAFCNGALMAISQNTALFNLIGTTYGGDGQTTFAVPDLQGRIPVHQGSGFTLGQESGSESVTLATNQLPIHSHLIPANSNPGTVTTPGGNVVAGTTMNPYTTAATDTSFGTQMIGNSGSSQPHDNLMPFLCISFVIALEGIFPTQ